MSETLEWTVLAFLGSLVAASMGIAWRARSILAENELKIAVLTAKYDIALAALANDIADRNFLSRYDLSIADLMKDVRHLKNNFEQHKSAAGLMHDDMIRTQAEIVRLAKIVNGKH